jgi:hypothetical protein
VSDFDPGPGWREMPRGTYAEQDDDTTLVLMAKGQPSRRWVREAPTPPLPTRPGYYIAQNPEYGGTVVVELLAHPEGRWADAGDRKYLTEDDVRGLLPLRRLVPIENVIRYFRREADPAVPNDWRRRVADTIEAEWEVEA